MTQQIRRAIDKLTSELNEIKPTPLIRMTIMAQRPDETDLEFEARKELARKDFDKIIVLVGMVRTNGVVHARNEVPARVEMAASTPSERGNRDQLDDIPGAEQQRTGRQRAVM